MSFGSALGVVGSIAGGLFGGGDDAADAQREAAQMQQMIELAIYQQTLQRMAPFYNSGVGAQNALAFELGLGPRPTYGGNPLAIESFTESTPSTFSRTKVGKGDWVTTGTPSTYNTRYRVGDEVFEDRAAAEAYANANATDTQEYQGFQETPGYQFAREQGIDAIDNSAASRGNAFSGATYKDLNEFGTGLANQEYNTFMNRLTDRANAGQAAAGAQATAGANYAAGSSQALANYGNAGAAGAIARGNALAGGISDAIGIWNYQNQQYKNNPDSGGGFWAGLFGG